MRVKVVKKLRSCNRLTLNSPQAIHHLQAILTHAGIDSSVVDKVLRCMLDA